ncbi:MAG: hypothetical protein NZ518_04755 [Dehalococcoidia bacterium]|nr:hypothetical protein [Dehalococcoidia bacterium]
MTTREDSPIDDVGQTEALLATLRRALPLEPLPLPEFIRHHEDAKGWEDLAVYTAPKIERLSIHRFFAIGRLREHLCLAWPADDYDLPALGLDLYEHPTSFTLVADFIPMRDVVTARDYYPTYIEPFRQTLYEWWPQLREHFVQPAPPPVMYFTAQLGSCLALHQPMQYSGLEVACAFQRAVAEAWAQMVVKAQPVPEAERAAFNAQKRYRIRSAFKLSDYQVAAKHMAFVLGWERTDAIFDAIFGPSLEEAEGAPAAR